jgi:hypothetical protein
MPVRERMQANKSGPHKTVYSPNGEQYRGCWRDNLRHGKGCLIYKNGAKYEGDWHAGLRHGLGSLWTYEGGKFRVKYTGGWSNDVPNGRGTYHDASANLYEGGWLEGRRAGQARVAAACACWHARMVCSTRCMRRCDVCGLEAWISLSHATRMRLAMSHACRL